MTYTEKDQHITLEMNRDEYEELLLVIGMGTGIALREKKDKEIARAFFRLVNKMNATNPKFIPYEISVDKNAKKRENRK